MSAERLLERIERWEREPRRRDANDRRSLESVLAHLRLLLNTRQGNVPIAADFGAPDFLSLLQSFPESVASMEGAIRTTIERYEPRLANVQVHFLPDQEDSLALQFEITARLRGDGECALSFESFIDLNGKVRIDSRGKQ